MSDFSSHIENVYKLFDEKKELFINKNKDYGCSYIKAGMILNMILDNQKIILEKTDDHVAYQIITRMLDKIIRYCNLRFIMKDKEGNVKEKSSDTLSDLGVYSLMLSELENNPLK
ncbi:MAG: hypothetical protein QXG00_06050 [Candidatus Woesearchaeota archaeon]